MIIRKIRPERKRGSLILCAAMLLLCVLVLCLLAGCASAPKAIADLAQDSMAHYSTAQSFRNEEAMVAAPAAAESPAAAPLMEDGEAKYAGSGTAYAATEEATPAGGGVRHIIQNASLSLEVQDIEEVVTALQELAEGAGGYVASREIYNIGEERRAGNVSLRVPAARFTPLVAAIKELGKIKNDHVYTDDVTMQYIDLEARITNLQAQEKRLRELLEKAEDIEDIIQVEKELGRVRGDLESMEGSFRHLRERVQYSTIDIQLQEKDARTVVVNQRFGGFGERLVGLLSLNTNRFLSGLSGFFVVAIGSLPIIIPLLLIVFLAWRAVILFRARNRKKLEQRDLPQERRDLSQ